MTSFAISFEQDVARASSPWIHGQDAHATFGAPFTLAQATGSQATHAANEKEAGKHAAADGRGEESGAYRMPAEFPNIVSLVQAYGKDHEEEEGVRSWFDPNPQWWLNPAFSIFYAIVFIAVIRKALGRRSIEKPSKPQVAVEMMFQGLLNFFGEIIGPAKARQYVPYVGSLWLFILVNKLAGLIPGFKTPWSDVEAVAGLGICTFLWVNGNAIRDGGLRHYFWHLCGSPTSAITWGMAPLMFLLETLGVIIKPVSLSLRLYGNTFGEDKLLASFLGMGMILSSIFFKTPTPMLGIPLHFPFMFLALLVSVIQSTVFALLAAVYIALLLPHEQHEGEHEHAEKEERQTVAHGSIH